MVCIACFGVSLDSFFIKELLFDELSTMNSVSVSVSFGSVVIVDLSMSQASLRESPC